MKKLLGKIDPSILVAVAIVFSICAVPYAAAQLIYGNTFPFWNVNGPLTVTGATVMSGTVTESGGTTISGTLTVSGQNALIGTTTASDAAAGYKGEYDAVAVSSGAAVATTNNTAVNVASLTLAAGDYDVTWTCDKTLANTTVTHYSCGLGVFTATQLDQAGNATSGVYTDPLAQVDQVASAASGVVTQRGGPTRVRLGASTVIYLVALDKYSGGGMANYGTLQARRIR